MKNSDYQAVRLGAGKSKATKASMNIEGGGAVRVLDKPNATEFDKNESLGIQTAGYDKSQDSEQSASSPGISLNFVSSARILRHGNEESYS